MAHLTKSEVSALVDEHGDDSDALAAALVESEELTAGDSAVVDSDGAWLAVALTTDGVPRVRPRGRGAPRCSGRARAVLDQDRSLGQRGGVVRIEVAGMPLEEWRYTLPEWWCVSYHELLQRIPTDGSARLLGGPPCVVAHLRATGKLPVNVTSAEHEVCDIAIRGVGFFGSVEEAS